MNSKRTRFTAYITKYALTAGIMKRDVEDCFDMAPDMVCSTDGRFTTYHRDDWHRTESEALAKAEDMRHRKIVSLRKQIAKMEALRFTVKP